MADASVTARAARGEVLVWGLLTFSPFRDRRACRIVRIPVSRSRKSARRAGAKLSSRAYTVGAHLFGRCEGVRQSDFLGGPRWSNAVAHHRQAAASRVVRDQLRKLATTVAAALCHLLQPSRESPPRRVRGRTASAGGGNGPCPTDTRFVDGVRQFATASNDELIDDLAGVIAASA